MWLSRSMEFTVLILKVQLGGLSWWSSVTMPMQGIRSNQGLDPWSRKIPCAAEQLSPCTTTIETVLWSSQATATEHTCRNS